MLAGLLPDDRIRLITFDSQVRVGPAAELPQRRGERGAALFDAIAGAAMLPAEAGFRRVVVALTAGIDGSSFLDARTRRMVLQRSDAVVYIIAIAGTPRAFAVEQAAGETRAVGDYDWVLRQIAEDTGGRLFTMEPNESFGHALTNSIREIRNRYVIRYRPAGVSTPGWHAVSLTINRSGTYDLRLRPGYLR